MFEVSKMFNVTLRLLRLYRTIKIEQLIPLPPSLVKRRGRKVPLFPREGFRVSSFT
jgi:hypothetical protein